MRVAPWILTAALASGCSSSSSSSSPIPPAPPAISVLTAGTLRIVGDLLAASATQGSYHGPFTYISSKGAVLGLSLNPPRYQTKFSSRVVSPDGKVYVVAVGTGTASVTVYGSQGLMASPPALQNVTIASATPVKVQPGQLSFAATGAGNAKTATVTQDGYSGRFSQSNSCAHIASVMEKTNAGGKASYLVTPLGTGSCAAVFAGGNAKSATLPISVSLASKIVVAPSSLTLKTTASIDVDVSQNNYTDAFRESDTCARVAGILAKRNNGGKAKYVVTPIGNGACNATFTGGGGESAKLPISVALPHVKLSPANLTFLTSGSSSAQTVTVSQKGFDGSFTEADDCANVATVVATSNGHGAATYRVTASATGACNATFTGASRERARLPIAVALPGPVVLVPTTLNFSGTGPGHAQNVSASQSGYSGAFTEIDDCSGIATIVPSPTIHGTFVVTPNNDGSCTAVFTGGNHQTAPLPILVVVPGGVTASPSPLNFLATGASNAIVETVTQSSYGGTFMESDTCSVIAAFTVLTNGSGSATYRVTPLAAGICEAVFTGGAAETFVLAVTVTETGFGVQVRRAHQGVRR